MYGPRSTRECLILLAQLAREYVRGLLAGKRR